MRSRSSSASRSESLVCPLCEVSRLRPSGPDSMGCEWCGGSLSGAMLETLRRKCAVPDVLGSHLATRRKAVEFPKAHRGLPG
jgi:hypothetical protein